MDTGLIRERLYAESLRRIAASMAYARSLVPPNSSQAKELARLRSDVIDLHYDATRGKANVLAE